MTVHLRILAHGLSLSTRTEGLIRKSAESLERFYSGDLGCQVVVEGPDQRLGAAFRARIDLSLPGQDLIIDRQEAAELEEALRKAFAAAQRRLQEHQG